MSFQTIEISADGGRPIELLQISFSQETWYYTTSEVAIVHDLNTYIPIPFKRGKVETTGDATKATLSLQLPYDSPVGNLFRIRPPSEVVTITLFQQHYSDTDYRVIWKGRITASNWQLPWLELTVENVFTSLMRNGIRRRFSVPCTHVLYRGGCRLNKDDWKVVGPVDSIAGMTLSVSEIAAAPVNYYAGGFAEWVNSSTGAPESMMIQTSAPGTVSLSSSPLGLTVGDSVNLYPGCSRLINVCHSKFNNALNHGGTPYIPTTNPFDGTAIY